MGRFNILQWVQQAKRRERLILALVQPMTASQLSWKTDISSDCCSFVLKELEARDLVRCLNPVSRRSRLYWLTEKGQNCLKKLSSESTNDLGEEDYSRVDWDLYGWLCFSHRAAVTVALTEPLQPSAIKKKLRHLMPDVRISANNIRDTIKLLLHRGVVMPVPTKKKVHLRYELTDAGKMLRRLLLRGGMKTLNVNHMPTLNG